MLDLHGEYAQALSAVAQVFRINAEANETPLHIPFWALEPYDLFAFLMGRLDDKPLTAILDRVYEYKHRQAENHPRLGLNITSMTSDNQSGLEVDQLLTHPVIGSILPNDILSTDEFESYGFGHDDNGNERCYRNANIRRDDNEGAGKLLRKLDAALASSSLNLGAYIVVKGSKL